MRKTTLLLCFVYALFFACSEDEQPQLQEKEKVQFGFDLQRNDDSGGRISEDIPAGAIASVEIWGPTGTIKEELEILKFGESYLTDPIELPTGMHKLLSFMIIDPEREVLFAAPKEGSPLEPLVDNALPQTFNVQAGRIRNVAVQVLEVGEHAPEMFGYASFGIDVVRPLAISVFIEQEGKLVLTEAMASIFVNGIDEPLQEFELDNKVNHIPFRGEGSDTHTLLIQKAGYAPARVTFTYDDLGSEKSLSVTLQAEVALMLTKTIRNNGVYEFAFNGSQDATITVDWGDGNIENVYFVATRDEFGRNIKHTYADANSAANIRITGDLQYITRFGLLWNYAETDLSILTNLEILGVEYSDMNAVDVSMNSKVREFVFIESVIDDLILGDDKTRLKVWDFLTIKHVETLDEIISEMHANTLRHDITNGSSYGYGNAPFTSAMESKLRELDETYGWTIQQEGYE